MGYSKDSKKPVVFLHPTLWTLLENKEEKTPKTRLMIVGLSDPLGWFADPLIRWSADPLIR